MSQHWIKDVVKGYVEGLEHKAIRYQVHDCTGSTRLFYCLTNSCLAAFFGIVPKNLPLDGYVPDAEEEIRTFRDERNWNYRDLNLVLLLEQPPTQQVLSDLRHDTVLCRKFPFYAVDAHTLQSQLANLPFFPLEAGEALSLQVHSLSPEVLLKRSGASEQLSRALMAHSPGAKRLAASVVKPDYILTDAVNGSANNLPIDHVKYTPIAQKDSDYGVSLKTISINNFRGIGRKTELALGQGITLLYGINGTGKTSVCDAIEWAVSGRLAITETPDDDAKQLEAAHSVINYFSASQEASVELILGDMGTHVKRSIDDNLRQTVYASVEDTNWGAIITTTHSHRRTGFDLNRARDAFRSCHILEQSTIRQFLNRTPSERFDALNRILGYEEIVRLSRKLESVCRFVKEEARNREPTKAKALEKLLAAESEVETLQHDIESRESSLTAQPAVDEIVKMATAEAVAYALPVPAMPDTSSLPAVKHWVADVNEVLNAVGASLKDTLNRAAEHLQPVNEFDEQRQEVEDLKLTITRNESEVKELQDKQLLFVSKLTHAAIKLTELKEQQDTVLRILTSIQWARTNSATLRQEEKRLGVDQEELVQRDELIQKKKAEIQQIKDNMTAIATKIVENTEEMKKVSAKREDLDHIISLYPEWRIVSAQLSDLADHDQGLEKQIAIQEMDIKKLIAKQSKIERTFKKYEKQVQEKEALNTHRAHLLADLRQTLRPSETICPLCGCSYDGYEDLLCHMDGVEEAPSEDYRSVLSEAEEAQKQLSTVQNDLKVRNEQLTVLNKQHLYLTEKFKTAKTRVLEIREKASLLNVIAVETDITSIPAEERFHAALKECEVVDIQQQLGEMKLQDEMYTSNLTQIQDILQEYTIKRRSLAVDIEERRNYVNSLRAQASDAGALDLLNLSENDIQTRIDRQQEEKKEMSTTMLHLNESTQLLTKKQGEIHQQISDMQQSLHLWQNRMTTFSQREAELKASLLTFGMEGDLSPVAITEFQADIETRLVGIHTLQQRCSVLSSILQLNTLREALSQAEKVAEQAKSDLSLTSQEIQEVVDKARTLTGLSTTFQEVTVSDMTATLNALATPMNSIFERLNGHPLFGSLKIEPNEKKKTVVFRVETPAREEGALSGDLPPRSYLSDAQLNIVALSIFLSIALYQTWSKFKLIVVDDPVQQMDDLNAASFIDLIREVSTQNRRQFLITTCNYAFYRLALTKLSCLNTRNVTRFRAYRLEGLRREGPEFIVDAPFWENEEQKAIGLKQDCSIK